jgi:hypothetical protein
MKSEFEEGARRLRSFTGYEAEAVANIRPPRVPSVGLVVGTCDGVLYTTRTTRSGGKVEKYIHKFAQADKPLLVVSPDGRQLMLIGGRFRFTERGIVDASDRSG